MSIYYVGVLPIRGLQCQWTPLLAEGSLAAGIRQRDGVRTARRGPSSETRSLQWDGVPPARRGPSNGTEARRLGRAPLRSGSTAGRRLTAHAFEPSTLHLVANFEFAALEIVKWNECEAAECPPWGRLFAKDD